MTNSIDKNSLLICGLPESGKSTFLGALSYLINSGETNTVLQEKSWAEDRTYLNQLAQRWLECKPMERTRKGDIHAIELILDGNSVPFQLFIPDLSGETWNDIWSKRICPENIVKHAQQAGGILLFIHADKIEKPVPITAINAMDEVVGEEGEVHEAEPWDPDRCSPTQVAIVDILQLLARPPLTTNSTKKLVVILSAWDLVLEHGLSPQEHLANEFPLLNQYLKAGFSYSDWTVFGVSALGGDLDKDEGKLAEKDNPSERIIVRSGDNTYHDLTLPIKWLLEK